VGLICRRPAPGRIRGEGAAPTGQIAKPNRRWVRAKKNGHDAINAREPPSRIPDA